MSEESTGPNLRSRSQSTPRINYYNSTRSNQQPKRPKKKIVIALPPQRTRTRIMASLEDVANDVDQMKRGLEELRQDSQARAAQSQQIMDCLNSLTTQLANLKKGEQQSQQSTSSSISACSVRDQTETSAKQVVYSQSHSVHIVEIRKFDGDANKAADWLSDYESNATLMNWDDNTKLRCAFKAFERQIRPWYNREIKNQPTMTWQRFVEKFERSFNVKSRMRCLQQIGTTKKPEST